MLGFYYNSIWISHIEEKQENTQRRKALGVFLFLIKNGPQVVRAELFLSGLFNSPLEIVSSLFFKMFEMLGFENSVSFKHFSAKHRASRIEIIF